MSNTTARSVAIHAVKPSDKCHVWMKLCNEPGQLCSGISRMCLTAGSAKGMWRTTVTFCRGRGSWVKVVGRVKVVCNRKRYLTY